jgi:hypothetical protein
MKYFCFVVLVEVKKSVCLTFEITTFEACDLCLVETHASVELLAHLLTFSGLDL